MPNHVPPAPEQPGGLNQASAPIACLSLIFLLNVLSRIVLAPLLSIIEVELKIGHAESGAMFFLISAGFCLAQFCSGFVSGRLGHRGTILISALGVAVGLGVVALGWNLNSIRLGLIVLGLGSGLYLPSAVASLTEAVAQQLWARALSIHQIAPSVAFVVAPFLASTLQHRLGWRGVLGLIAVLSALSALIFVLFGQGSRRAGQPPNLPVLKELARDRGFWIMVFTFALAVGASQGLYSMTPLYLETERGFGRDLVNLLVALSRASALGGLLVFGYLVGRFDQRKTMLAALVATGATTVLFGLLPDWGVVPAMFLQAVLVICFFPVLFAVVALVVPPRTKNVAMSLMLTVGHPVGGGLIPALLGFLGERGGFGPGIAALGAGLLAVVFLFRRLRVPEAPVPA